MMIGFGQLLYTFKAEKVPLIDLFYDGVGEFSELQNIKYESMGLKISMPERQLNVLLELFKQTSKTMQKTNKIKKIIDIILILEDTLCHITYVTS